NSGGSGTLDRPRSGASAPDGPDRLMGSGAGSASAGSGGAPDGLGKLRASAGDPGGEGLTPSVVRSEIEGAIGKNRGKVPAALRLRTSPARGKIAFDMGASEESERAVEASLQWLAGRQHPQGYWEPIESTLGKEPDPTVRFSNPQERERSGFNAHAGLTALAVLAFLGKGYTHENNPYADNVDRALRWLISRQDSQGYLGAQANPYARMYCHGMATIALGEAYGMTRDPALHDPLVRAVQYIVNSQSTDGGWRYFKGKQGDMSMFGWQLMALKSARNAGLVVPRSAMNRATDFLIAHGDDLKNRNLSQFGGLAAYRIDERPKPSMTAEALFCKQMLGIRRTNRAAGEAVEYLLKNLPQRSRQDLYYWYYGTLAMYQHGGESWQRWNQALRDLLVADQRSDGDFAGSWNPRAPWGDYGGRVYSTAMSTLCLEVYYRFLPENDEPLDKAAGK
ncbi:MAG: prenyltransferase/squalene oxidase repeat-containing protein, partial [Deltaproteobacteria bacterium]